MSEGTVAARITSMTWAMGACAAAMIVAWAMGAVNNDVPTMVIVVVMVTVMNYCRTMVIAIGVMTAAVSAFITYIYPRVGIIVVVGCVMTANG